MPNVFLSHFEETDKAYITRLLSGLSRILEGNFDGLAPQQNNSIKGATDSNLMERSNPTQLSEHESNLLKYLLLRNSERQMAYQSSQVRVCVDGKERLNCYLSPGSNETCRISLNASFLEVFGQDNEGEILLDIIPLPELELLEGDEAQMLPVKHEVGENFEVIISSVCEGNHGEPEAVIQIRCKESAVFEDELDKSPEDISKYLKAKEATLLHNLLSFISERSNYQNSNSYLWPALSAAQEGSNVYIQLPSQVVNDLLRFRDAFLTEGASGKSYLAECKPIPLTQGSEEPNEEATLPPVTLSVNPKCTFHTFVVGSCNQFAHAAALAVVESRKMTYNPLFIYGGVGLGKTHLLCAIGNAFIEQSRGLRIVYMSAEKFMNELINAIRYDKAQTFREKYRSIDVLLMDDIQFMAGKERTQEEFFHTFNALYDGQKQIVITSDCPPREIPTLEERLHSRFEWGLIADIEPPDLETKVAILKRKADFDGVVLPDDVAFFIASKVKSNIRELEGSLVRLIAISSLRGLPISKMLAQDAIRNIAEDDRPAGITIEQIQSTVAAHYRLRVNDLKSKNNSRQIVVPRQVAMYLCKRLTRHSFPEIGREFGGKHHTAVIHSVGKIEYLVSKDYNFNRVITDLMDKLSV